MRSKSLALLFVLCSLSEMFFVSRLGGVVYIVVKQVGGVQKIEYSSKALILEFPHPTVNR